MYIPIMIEKDRLRVTIFGGGDVALRKVKILEGAYVKVVSDKIQEEIRKYAKRIILEKIREEDDIERLISDSNFVIIATDDRKLNLKIRDVCEKRGIIYNLVDDRDSLAIFPSFLRDDDLIISFSTSGRAPALSKFLKEIASSYIKSLDVIEKIRMNIEHDENKRSEFFSSLFRDCNFWMLIERGEKDRAFLYAMEKWRMNYEIN